MGRFSPRFLSVTLVSLLLMIPYSRASQQQQKPNKKEKALKKEVLSFDGGIMFATEGSLSELTCFRLDGRVAAPGFFDDFKRIDDEHGTEYRSNKEIVTELPEEVHVAFVMFDTPCKSRELQPVPRRYLTQEMMESLRFSFSGSAASRCGTWRISSLRRQPLNSSSPSTQKAKRNCQSATGGFWSSQFLALACH